MVKFNKKHVGKQPQTVEQKYAEYTRQDQEIADCKAQLGYGQMDHATFLKLQLPDIELSKAADVVALQQTLRTLLEERSMLDKERAVVQELNQRHAVIHLDQFYILTEKPHPIFKTRDFSLESRQSFRYTYEAQKVLCHDGKVRSKADIWLDSEQRRSYDGIVFDPTIIGPSDGKYNLWTGFAKAPAQGDVSKYWWHVEHVICSGNKDAFEYVRNWLALLFQQPNKIHTALVLCGSQGTGKNRFVDPLGALFGMHYTCLSGMNDLTSNFNFHLKHSVLVHANEASWGGYRKDDGKLKAMVTEELCLIEGKGRDTIMMRNFKHLIISSNDNWPVRLDRDDRRYYVLAVSECKKENHKYFAELQKQLDDRGYEALLYDLLHLDVSSFNPRSMPLSKAAFAVKLQSQDSVERYLYEALLAGNFVVGAGQDGIWQYEIPKDQVYQDYSLWCKESGERQVQRHIFGMAMKKTLKSVGSGRGGSGITRATVYKFQSLQQVREEFCKVFKEDMSIFAEHDESTSDHNTQDNGSEEDVISTQQILPGCVTKSSMNMP